MSYAQYTCNATANYINVYSDNTCTTVSNTITTPLNSNKTSCQSFYLFLACQRSGNDYSIASCESNITDFYMQNTYPALVQLEYDNGTCGGDPTRIFAYRTDYCALVSSNGPQYTKYTCNATHHITYNLCSDPACTVGCQVISAELLPQCMQGVYQFCWAVNTSVK